MIIEHNCLLLNICVVPVALIKNLIACLGLKTSCVLPSQTESSVIAAEPSGGGRNRCSADICTSKPSLGTLAPGPNAVQTATGSTAAATPPDAAAPADPPASAAPSAPTVLAAPESDPWPPSDAAPAAFVSQARLAADPAAAADGCPGAAAPEAAF